MPASSGPSTPVEPQPSVSLRTIPNVRLTKLAVTSTAPDTSKCRDLLGAAEAGITRRPNTTGGGEHRAAEALQRACREQQVAGVGQGARKRGEREQRRARDEHALAPQQVRGAPAKLAGLLPTIG